MRNYQIILDRICAICGERYGTHQAEHMFCPSKRQRLIGVTEWDTTQFIELKE
jgi:hypothetical protein